MAGTCATYLHPTTGEASALPGAVRTLGHGEAPSPHFAGVVQGRQVLHERNGGVMFERTLVPFWVAMLWGILKVLVFFGGTDYLGGAQL